MKMNMISGSVSVIMFFTYLSGIMQSEKSIEPELLNTDKLILEQTAPGDIPEIFAPGSEQDPSNEYGLGISPEYNESFYTRESVCEEAGHNGLYLLLTWEGEIYRLNYKTSQLLLEPHD